MSRTTTTATLLGVLLVLVSGATVGLVAGSHAPATTQSDVSPVQFAMDDEHEDNETDENETTTNATADDETTDNVTADNVTADNVTADNVTADNVTADNVTQANVTVENASVEFLNQTSDGTMVVVNSTALPEGGFVVIHLGDRTSPGNFSVGPVIGNSSYLEPGVHENLTVALDPAINESQWLVAMPHRDTNDNQTYDFPGADDPYFADGSIPVTDEAFVEVVPGAEMNVTEEPAVNVTVGNETEMPAGNETAMNETAANETAMNETAGNESAALAGVDL